MSESNTAHKTKRPRRPPHWSVFFLVVIFIAVAGYFFAQFSERSYRNKETPNSVQLKDQLTGNEQAAAESVKPEKTAAEPAVVKIDIDKNPLQHVRQEQLKVSFQQSVAMLHIQRYDMAIVALHKVLAIDPQMPEAHTNMGYALLGLKRTAAARDFFMTALELDDNQLNAYFGLAESYAELDQYHSAIGAIVAYIHLSPDSEPYLEKAHKKLQAWRDKVAENETAEVATQIADKMVGFELIDMPASPLPETADGVCADDSSGSMENLHASPKS